MKRIVPVVCALLGASLILACCGQPASPKAEEPAPATPTFTVTFDAQAADATGVSAPVTVEKGAKVAKPANPSRSGYLFAGWCTTSACTSPFNFTSAKITADRTLYAFWVEDVSDEQVSRSAKSSLPQGSTTGIPQPSAATPGNLEVLDWAGFSSAVSYTFDDGQPSQVDNYEALNALRVPFTFFITKNWADTSTDFVETWSKAVTDGHELGNHTVTHHRANGGESGTGDTILTPAINELDDCTEYVQTTLGANEVTSFAAPYGDTGWQTYAQERFFLNRGVGGGSIGANDSTNPFNLPCTMASGGETAASFKAGLDAARTNGKWMIYLFHAVLPGANWYAGVQVEDLKNTVAYSKSMDDMWIDTMTNVGAYWLGQKALAGASSVTAGDGTVTWTWTLPEHFPQGRYLRVTVDGGSVSQNGVPVNWDSHGYYEIALDELSLSVAP